MLTLKGGHVDEPSLNLSLPTDAILGDAVHWVSWCLKLDVLSPGQGCQETERVVFLMVT